ncbi:hypothetical protein ACFLSY_11170 [Bacteroidota bacterium]
MKRKLIFWILFLVIILSSCKQGENESKSDTGTPITEQKTEEESKKPQVYIKTVSAVGVDENQVKTDTITTIDTDYFEVGLYLMVDETNYTTKKDIVKPTSIENFKSVFFYLVDNDGMKINFKGSTEFLNFMSERGYEMVDQVKFDYHTDYTFKKRD